MMLGLIGYKGFLGSNFYNYAKIKKHIVDVFDGNVLDFESLELFIKQDDIDKIYYLAGKNNPVEDTTLLNNNILGMYNVAYLCCVNNKRLIYSNAQYDKNDSYGLSKQMASNIMKFYSYWGLNSVDIFFPRLFGPGCKPYKNSFVSTVLYCYVKGKYSDVKILDYETIFDLMYIDDACRALLWPWFDMTKGYHKCSLCDTYDSLVTGIFKTSFRQILAMLNDYYICSDEILKTLEWYKNNEF